MEQINNPSQSSELFIVDPAGTATRSVAGSVDVTLDSNAAAADIIVLTGLLGAGINVNIPLLGGNAFPQVQSASAAASNSLGQSRKIHILDNHTGAFQITVRGVDLTNPAVPIFGTGPLLPLPAAATPSTAIFSLDGLNYGKAAPSVAFP